jgi:hypothetical protein
MQRHGKHICTATDTDATTEELLEAVFPVWSAWRLKSKGPTEKVSESEVRGGS